MTGQVKSGGIYTAGVMISTNGGSSWTAQKILDQDGSQSRVAAFAPSNIKVLYVGSNSSSWTGLIHKSANGGASWTSVTNGITAVPESIAVDPQNPDIVYVGTYYDLWRSANGGASWTKCAFPTYSYRFGGVAFNAKDPREVFVGCGKGVFYSRDRGLTWTDLSEGLLIRNVNQLSFNATTRTLYVATSGGGIWKKTM